MATKTALTATEFYRLAGRKLGESVFGEVHKDLFENGYALYTGMEVFYFLY